jgi:HD-like signal output (HDOD) protein
MPKCQRLGGFTAGLLHDLGKIFMLEHFSEAYREVHQELGKNGHHLFELEEKRFGLNHAAIGEFLAANWNLPEALIRAIAFHHQPFSAPSHGEMAALIGLADYLHYRAVLTEEGLEKTPLAPPLLTVGHWQILQEHFKALDNEELATMTEQARVTLNQNENLFAMLD